ncbi:MAG: dihydrolipoyl dehydrogenase [Saprospiraceae bacterium]|nr:dihydrolipoyl dehydrogenase [Saprospiraceae bacterium]
MKYDITVIGSGPGGYIAAVRCAQLGMKVAIVEKYNTLGGTCLNVGCIPSKALLDSSEHYFNAQHTFSEHGIGVGKLELDFPQMIKRKSEVVGVTTGGVEYLMKKNKIDVFTGMGSFKDKNTILVSGEKEQTIQTDKVIIATGSKPSTLPFIKIDKKRVITSTEALELQKLPKSMTIIGAGIIGCELGSVYARLGTKVTIVEYLDRIVPGMDKDIAKELMRSMKKNLKIDFQLSHKVTAVSTTTRSTTVTAENKKGESVEFKAEYCLVAVGRRPYTEGLGLEHIGVSTDERGRIPVDEHFQTAVPGVYAIGDVIKGAMLAHKAEEEGVCVAEFIAGQKPHINYRLIPGVVYTWPEGAGVGYLEEELKEMGREYKVGKFPFKASGRARASMDTEGFVKVIADKETDEILGVHMLGPRIADLIAEAVVAMEYRATAEDIGRMSHAHPTFAEAMKEAALDAWAGMPLNI